MGLGLGYTPSKPKRAPLVVFVPRSQVRVVASPGRVVFVGAAWPCCCVKTCCLLCCFVGCFLGGSAVNVEDGLGFRGRR